MRYRFWYIVATVELRLDEYAYRLWYWIGERRDWHE